MNFLGKTVGGLILGGFLGAFVAVGIVVFTTLIGAGAEKIGFTEVTYWYYVVCLCICVTLLIISKKARQHIQWMGLFFVAVIAVIAIGLNVLAAPPSGGTGSVAAAGESLLSFAILFAKGIMYVAPGGLTAFYAVNAYSGLPITTSK